MHTQHPTHHFIKQRFPWRSRILMMLLLSSSPAWAADKIWTGISSVLWTNPSNWGGSGLASNDSLFFAGSKGLTNINNLATTNIYSGITFNSNSGPFSLLGNPIILKGGITNNSSQAQTIGLDIESRDDLIIDASPNGDLVLSGNLTSTNGSLTKWGAGKLILGGTNTYPGGTVICEGTLSILDGHKLGAKGGGIVLDGGTLEVGNLVTLNDRILTLTTNGGTLDVDQLSVLTVTNAVVGPGDLTKTGPGVLTLAGLVTSEGSLSVEGGLLLVNNSLSGPSSVTVYSGATLGGSGSIASDTFISDGGTLSPGTNDSSISYPCALSVSNLFLSPNSTVRLDLNAPGITGGTNDLIIVHGDLTLDGVLKVTGIGTKGLYPIIKYDGSLKNRGMILGSSVTGTLIIDTTNQVISLDAQSFPTAPPTAMGLLFIGNSLTFTYDIPGTIQELANAAGDWFTYGSDLIAGASLANHVATPLDIHLIDSGNYDIVMLQEHSSRPTIPNDRDNLMFPDVRTLNDHIVGHSERTMLYETWGYPAGDPGNYAKYDIPAQYRGCTSTSMGIAVRMAYARIAKEIGAAISPVGLAWLTVQSERPDIDLYYSPGDYHPGTAGSYLAACVHYAAIFGRSPVGNPAMGSLTDTNLAAYLQTVAERTVLTDPWGLDPYSFSSNQFYWAHTWPAFTNDSFTRLNGLVISGNGGLASPSVKIDVNAGRTNNVYLGVYGYNYEIAGQGRLFLNSGGALETDCMTVGKEGKGWLKQDGGNLKVNGTLTLGEQPSSAGYYTLLKGALTASQILHGKGTALFTQSGGQLSFGQFGSSGTRFNLVQGGGTLTPSNAATLYGDYSLNDSSTLVLALKNAPFQVTRNVTLAGTLALGVTPGFVPIIGQSYTLLTGKTVSGRFGRVVTPASMPPNLKFLVTYTSTSVICTICDALLDSLGTGLPDWWQFQYFGSLHSDQNWSNSFLPGGMPNGIMYVLGLDPTGVVPPEKQPHGSCSNGFLTYSYRQQAGGAGNIGVDYTCNKLSYTVMVSDDLASDSWLSGTDLVESTGSSIDNGDGTQTVSVRLRQPLNSSKPKFVRLMIQQQK